MNQAEFIKGWTLLILQPWGWRYRSMTADGRPSEESKQQLEFYFNKLQWAEAKAWWQVAELYAQGTEWPSVSALKTALQQVNARFVKALPAPEPLHEPMPDEVRDKIRTLTAHMSV